MNYLTLNQKLIDDLSSIHNNKYNYIKKEGRYLYIECPIHGVFKQRMDHHKNGHECKKCSTSTSSLVRLRPIKEIISLAKEIHKDENYDYSLNTKDIKAKEKLIIICPVHGKFNQSYDHHLRGAKCPQCSQINGNNLKRKNTETFIKEANIKHNFIYTYLKTDYIHNKQKVIITCPVHGDFEQMPYNHLIGKGCNQCRKESNLFLKESFIRFAKDKDCIFYILKCYNENEEFFKIGITSKSIKQRYNTKTSMPYNFIIIKELITSAEEVWDIEDNFKKKSKNLKYLPLISFNGSKTECFISL